MCIRAGQVGWGIAWYIEGVLIPELVVTRGSTYTFVVEGGTDSSDLARYHPFYITNSTNGGRLRNSPTKRDVSEACSYLPINITVHTCRMNLCMLDLMRGTIPLEVYLVDMCVGITAGVYYCNDFSQLVAIAHMLNLRMLAESEKHAAHLMTTWQLSLQRAPSVIQDHLACSLGVQMIAHQM